MNVIKIAHLGRPAYVGDQVQVSGSSPVCLPKP